MIRLSLADRAKKTGHLKMKMLYDKCNFCQTVINSIDIIDVWSCDIREPMTTDFTDVHKLQKAWNIVHAS